MPANYGFNDRHIKNIFVRKLVPQRLKAFVKLDLPIDFRNSRLYRKIKLAHPLAYPPPTYMPQPALASTIVPFNVLPSPSVIPQETLTPEMKLMSNKINELTSQLGELRVNQMGVGVKNDQPMDDRANVWCTNCRGQGHMKLDCPSPQALSPKCRYCGGDHDISPFSNDSTSTN